MHLADIFDTLLFSPLELVFDFIFRQSHRLLGSPGLSIIALSLAVNLLLMPLYRRADALQKEEREAEKRLEKGVAHIKKTFQGDERMMILQAYYRENHYKPTYALRSAAPLLLQIPFFLAAYRFLSGLALLQGVGFGPISDLSQPDGLLRIGGLAVNVLPFVMTGVNLVTATLFTRDAPKKEKLQLYGMAAFFLVFLYRSPSALVFYWTLNNVFSLCKTLLGKWKQSGAFLRWGLLLLGCAVGILGVVRWDGHSLRSLFLYVGAAAVGALPMAASLLAKRRSALPEQTPNKGMFFLSAAFLTVLTGLMIPANVIQSATWEFINVLLYLNPLWYVVSALCLAAGLFLVWLGVFYFLASPRGKVLFEKTLWVFCGWAVLDYLCFGTDLGNLAPNLVYDFGLNFTRQTQLVNLALLALLSVGMLVIRKRFPEFGKRMLAICLAAMVCSSLWSCVTIHRNAQAQRNKAQTPKEEDPKFTLSKNGQNVVVLMLDRGINAYIPYFFQENPELKAQFDGFTYYDNTISFGQCTKLGAPALFGGYEYTPARMNSRSGELLSEKHDEALKLMPSLFSQAGFQVTFYDPPLAGYQWKGDLSVFDDLENVTTGHVIGSFTNMVASLSSREDSMRNFFCYSLTKIAPVLVQPILYDEGNYNRNRELTQEEYRGQIPDGAHKADGINLDFMNSYDVLLHLPSMTQITEEGSYCLLMDNKLTHEPMLLQEPDYAPAWVVDNTEFDEENTGRFTLDGRTLRMEDRMDYASYQTNMAAMLQIGKWLDYLREQGVYDNTRIILVADHGADLGQSDELTLADGRDLQQLHALFMVKDFGSTGEAVTSGEFMTVADVPTLALSGIVENPVNPFTGVPISSREKTAHDQYVLFSSDWDILENNSDAFGKGSWYSVHDSIWNRENWTKIADYDVLYSEK